MSQPYFRIPMGYLIYKMTSKDTIPLDQARQEIKGILRTKAAGEPNASHSRVGDSDHRRSYFTR